MAKTPATIYVCQNCGRQERKWPGRCADCGEYSSFVEEKFRPTPQAKGINSPTSAFFREVKPIKFNEIESQESVRTSSGIDEFDRVLGGGIVPGSLVLIGGSPGIGKSTLVFRRG